ncbi:12215_t:CDS:2 [Gigaspora rosea]|nr:12215_t:CDS:2 [Gigaspora rosea]
MTSAVCTFDQKINIKNQHEESKSPKLDSEQNVNVPKESTYDAEIKNAVTFQDPKNFNHHENRMNLNLIISSMAHESISSMLSNSYAEQLCPLRERKEELGML